MKAAETTPIQLCVVENYWPIEKLKIHENNPRTIKPERLQALKDSIISKGFYQPILVWKRGNVILAGNHRFMAVQELIREGFSFDSPNGKVKHCLPVVIEDVEDEVAEAILFETNNTYAEWIEERLRLAIKDAEDRGVNTSDFGFTSAQVDNLLHNALEEAETISPPSPDMLGSLDPTDEAGVREAVGDEEFESLILPKPIYENMVALLSEIAVAINPEWNPGDSYADATEALILFCEKAGVKEICQKKASKPSSKASKLSTQKS